MRAARKDPEWTPPLFGWQYPIRRLEKLLEVLALPRNVNIWGYDDTGWVATFKVQQLQLDRRRGIRRRAIELTILEAHPKLDVLIRRFERRINSVVRGLGVLR